MKIEPIYRCNEALKAEREYDEVIYTSPDGIRYDQHEALSLIHIYDIRCRASGRSGSAGPDRP